MVVWIKRGSGISRREGGGRRKRWRWTKEGERGFRERIERVWQDKGEKEEVGWGEMKRDIQAILREGQGKAWGGRVVG